MYVIVGFISRQDTQVRNCGNEDEDATDTSDSESPGIVEMHGVAVEV
jgi:hypothetical protein